MKRKFKAPRKLESEKKPKVLIQFKKSLTILQPSSLSSNTEDLKEEKHEVNDHSQQDVQNSLVPRKFYSVLYKQGPTKSKKSWQDGVLIVSSTDVSLRSENYNYKKVFAAMSKRVFCIQNKDNSSVNVEKHEVHFSSDSEEYKLFQNDTCTGAYYCIQINEQITEYKWMKKMKEDEIVAQAAKEIGAGNIGRKLLSKMGWKPGDALSESGMKYPLTVTIKHDRAGLGCK
jgi:hypothetical protein